MQRGHRKSRAASPCPISPHEKEQQLSAGSVTRAGRKVGNLGGMTPIHPAMTAAKDVTATRLPMGSVAIQGFLLMYSVGLERHSPHLTPKKRLTNFRVSF